MPSERTIVLKFGGSVLRDEEALASAVHEVYRWRRDGWGVVAVVSVFEGRTDELIAACTRVNERPSGHAKAALVALGEAHSSATLGALLDRVGVPSCVLSPGAVSLRASGAALDAAPVSVDVGPIEAALERGEVVVFPGFVALDEAGRTVTLGRGGSDLTALFLADALGGARCRLVKDVDGLYDRDPKVEGARRYEEATHADALATDGTIVQHKAVRFARDRGVVFELGAFNAERVTRIGGTETVFAPEAATPRPIRVALLGCGTVGRGVYEHLLRRPELFEIVGVAVRDESRHSDIPAGLRTTDTVGLAASGVDLVIETIGGSGTALDAVEAALKTGASVITANKPLVAVHGARLLALAEANDAPFLFSGAVGGSAPVLEAVVERRARGCRLRAVRAVLNGTTNFVLGRLGAGASFQEALSEARRCGFAEADPSADLSGRDAAEKLRIIALVGGVELRGPVMTEGLGATTPLEGGRIRQVAAIGPSGRASVRLERTASADPLFDLPDEWNGAVLTFEDGEQVVVRGRGAGRWPTAEAVVADALALGRSRPDEAVIVSHGEVCRVA